MQSIWQVVIRIMTFVAVGSLQFFLQMTTNGMPALQAGFSFVLPRYVLVLKRRFVCHPLKRFRRSRKLYPYAVLFNLTKQKQTLIFKSGGNEDCFYRCRDVEIAPIQAGAGDNFVQREMIGGRRSHVGFTSQCGS